MTDREQWVADRREAIDSIARSQRPESWAGKETMPWHGFAITWREYITRRHEIEDQADAWATGEGRMDAVGQNGNDGHHYAGMCTDGSPCGTPPEDGDDAYCLGCPNYAEDSDAESALSQAMSMPSKYHVRLKGAWCDVYDVLQAFGVTNPADQHALKKMLMPGKRGHKDGIQDRREAIQSLHRAIELEGK